MATKPTIVENDKAVFNVINIFKYLFFEKYFRNQCNYNVKTINGET